MNLIEKKGFKFYCRDYPRFDDEFCVNEVVVKDVYKMKEWKFENGTIIDIGSNIGTFAIPASKYGKVLAYEPDPHNYQILLMNIAINKVNVKAFNLAVGKPGEDVIENASGHSRLGSIGGSGGTKVKVIGFDDICNSLPIDKYMINMGKWDCEGGEYNLIKYASIENLKRMDKICGELHSWLFEDKDYSRQHKEMIEKIESIFDIEYKGYKNSAFFGVNKNGIERARNK